MAKSLPKIPKLLQRKIYKTGQTRGADDDVIYQNRVGRNSTVLIPYAYFDICSVAPDQDGVFERGYIVLIKPEDYFDNAAFKAEMTEKQLVLGENALLFYETREQWHTYNPDKKGFIPPNSRTTPLGGQYVARVPSTTAAKDEKINRGYTTSGLKGAGIRIYEYSSSNNTIDCRLQLEYVFWLCYDADKVMLEEGMTQDQIDLRRKEITLIADEKGLADRDHLIASRIINDEDQCICPLCLKPLSANGFLNRLEQAHGRDVPDLTVTQINLFHIDELKTGEFNHRPYNLGWGHHHCNVVVKDSGIEDTLKWMDEVIENNIKAGFEPKTDVTTV